MFLWVLRTPLTVSDVPEEQAMSAGVESMFLRVGKLEFEFLKYVRDFFGK